MNGLWNTVWVHWDGESQGSLDRHWTLSSVRSVWCCHRRGFLCTSPLRLIPNTSHRVTARNVSRPGKWFETMGIPVEHGSATHDKGLLVFHPPFTCESGVKTVWPFSRTNYPDKINVVGDIPQSSHWLPKCWGNRALTRIIHFLTPGGNSVGHLSIYEWWRKVKILVSWNILICL